MTIVKLIGKYKYNWLELVLMNSILKVKARVENKSRKENEDGVKKGVRT